jgi:sugar/nucleoside kinase (ribokinase family)
MLVPCYAVEVSGTTGAGDATVAGFLAGVLHGESLEEAMRSATAAGACSVSGLTAIDHIPKWPELKQWMSDR